MIRFNQYATDRDFTAKFPPRDAEDIEKARAVEAYVTSAKRTAELELSALRDEDLIYIGKLITHFSELDGTTRRVVDLIGFLTRDEYLRQTSSDANDADALKLLVAVLETLKDERFHCLEVDKLVTLHAYAMLRHTLAHFTLHRVPHLDGYFGWSLSTAALRRRGFGDQRNKLGYFAYTFDELKRKSIELEVLARWFGTTMEQLMAATDPAEERFVR